MRTTIGLAVIAGLTTLASWAAGAEELTIERLVASPSLDGEKVTALKISPDGRRVTFLQGKADKAEQQDLWEYDTSSGEARLLVDSATLLPDGEELDEVEKARRERQRIFASGIIEYFWSPDSQALLFPLGGDLYYLPLGGEVRRITETEAFETDPKFSPGGTYVSYVREQNLYITDLASGEERAITTDGAGTVAYGIADFAAQEEMDRYTGYWWSPNERYLAYARVDDTPVAPVDLYEISDTGVKVIPKRYPFAGTPNALIDLYVADLVDGSLAHVDMGAERDIYLARAEWLPGSDKLSFQRESRDQKRLELLFADPESGNSEVILTETAESWINLHNDLRFIDGGASFLWTSERTGFRHLYLVTDNGQTQRQITAGDWAIVHTGRRPKGIVAVDEEQGLAYIAGFADTPLQLHLYAVSYREPGAPVRLTREAGWHQTEVSVGGGFFVDNWSAPGTPPRTALKSLDGTLKGYIRENALDEDHPYYPYADELPEPMYGTLEAEDGATLYYKLMRPAGFDPARTYPAIVWTYGGPGTGRQVTHTWGVDLNDVLRQNGYVVFSLDNRGTPDRGVAFESHLYRRMGEVEVTDQLTGVAHLKSLPYVDGERVGITGGSYGGYMTLMGLFKAGEAFRAGVARSPVTDWRLYDTHYTERYLGDPGAAGDVYENSSVFKYIDGYQGGLLLVHGMADDNVFFDNSVKLMKRMQDAGKQFELMTYPGERHRLTGEATQAHFYHTALKFFDRMLKE